MTVTDAIDLDGEPSDAELIEILELVRQDRHFLPFLKSQAPLYYQRVVEQLQQAAVTTRSEAWRDPDSDAGGRPSQLIPGTKGSFSDRVDWLTWLLMGGRGSGKSKTGAEATREMVLGRDWGEEPRWALVGQTLDAVRLDMVENSLLECLPSGTVEKWNRGPCELYLTNGAFLKGYSSEAPRKLRGPNFHGCWADELATWTDANRSPSAPDTTWSNMSMAVRAHDNHTWTPRIIATTTPRNATLLRNLDAKDPQNPGPGLYDDPTTVVSNMSTLENRKNLSEHYLKVRVKPLIGTRLYDQEILGMLVNESSEALWSTELVESMVFPQTYPELQGGGLERIVIGVDPSVGAGNGDECGIIVSGLAYDGHVYVLEDASVRANAATYCRVIDRMYRKWNADAAVVETNVGGELLEGTLGRYAPSLPILNVFAKKGKRLRAEPVALLSDQGRLRLAGRFPTLETQMRTWEGTGPSPDRLDGFVYSVLYLMPAGTLEELVSVRRYNGR